MLDVGLSRCEDWCVLDLGIASKSLVRAGCHDFNGVASKSCALYQSYIRCLKAGQREVYVYDMDIERIVKLSK